MKYERLEYPRPQFRRDEWMPLNGEWEFAFDDENKGVKLGWQKGNIKLDKLINVPFAYQTEASGINLEEVHETVWYRRSFTVAKENVGKRAMLCFNAADYETDVWVNGEHATYHRGGYAPFSKDITDFLVDGENVIVVRCIDKDDPTVPRGKQSWTGERFGCWYVANTGIWQSVWIEFFGDDAISSWNIQADMDDFNVEGDLETLYGKATDVEIVITYDNKLIKKQKFSLDKDYTRFDIKLFEHGFEGTEYFWWPDDPHLFYVDIALYCDEKVVDRAHTRFGMRKLSRTDDGKMLINDREFYQRLILDQGYWKESGITPPSVDAIKKDIELSRAMGFNGARKHQKFEDPYFYYLAEEIGFVTWCEMPSSYRFNDREIAEHSREWTEIVRAAKNFTSVVCYVPVNESWGVRRVLNDIRQQDYARSLYYLTHSLDSTRPVSTNDGWECLDATDVIGIHDYAIDSSKFEEKYYADNYDYVFPQGRKLMAEDCEYAGQPVLFTEFGGIAMSKSLGGENWGYNESAKSDEEFYARLANLMDGLLKVDFWGYCYTQLTDVQQEVNGLLDENHEPKFDCDRLKKLFVNGK